MREKWWIRNFLPVKQNEFQKSWHANHERARVILISFDYWNEQTCKNRILKDNDKGTTEDEMAGWHHWLDGHKSEWTPGFGDGQGGLACCDSWGCKESDRTERLNWTELKDNDIRTDTRTKFAALYSTKTELYVRGQILVVDTRVTAL